MAMYTLELRLFPLVSTLSMSIPIEGLKHSAFSIFGEVTVAKHQRKILMRNKLKKLTEQNDKRNENDNDEVLVSRDDGLDAAVVVGADAVAVAVAVLGVDLCGHAEARLVEHAPRAGVQAHLVPEPVQQLLSTGATKEGK